MLLQKSKKEKNSNSHLDPIHKICVIKTKKDFYFIKHIPVNYVYAKCFVNKKRNDFSRYFSGAHMCVCVQLEICLNIQKIAML